MLLYDAILGSIAALCHVCFPGAPNRGMLTKKCDDEYLQDLEGWPASGQKKRPLWLNKCKIKIIS